ncbi:TPR-like protein [Dioscorea alata]|uniref:TPR-like protein n=1 Tax=Dioscorea alata TaxID=55571 RepID=A0ACB7WW34_DIOAL|nr:TPR-like protein [Dioscorea alata]
MTPWIRFLWQRSLFFSFKSLCTKANYVEPRNDIFWWNAAITECFRHGDVRRAHKLFDEMPHRNLVTWNCMISGYVRNYMILQALRIFDVMPSKNIVSWTALLTGYCKLGRLDEARVLFNKIPEKNVVCWNSMISGYIKKGDIMAASLLFDEMPMKNNISWAIMIKGYLQHKLVPQARALFDRAPVRATAIYNAFLSGYVELGRYKDAEELYSQMDEKNLVSWNTMITCYSRSGRMGSAKLLFEGIPEKDTISWTALIRGYLQNGDIDPAKRLFEQMPVRDVMAWNTMIGGLVQHGMIEDAMHLFDEMPQRDVVSWNTILQAHVQQGDTAKACSFFDRMPCKSETSWNTLISGCRSEEALVMFRQMVREGFSPDQVTFAVVISVCASLVALGWGKMLHLYAWRAGYEHDHTLVMSSLISMYSSCGLLGDANQVFKCMLKHDTISWNAMIAAYAYHGFAAEAFELFEEMIRTGFIPDHVTFLGLLSACAHRGLVDAGCRYFIRMHKDWKLIPRPQHFSCVVDLLGRSGMINQAHDLVNRMPPMVDNDHAAAHANNNAWETLLSACRFHGNLELGQVAAQRVLQAQPLDGGMCIILANIYAAKGMWQDATSMRALMRARGVKKETGCSWIEVNGRMHSFMSNDKSHQSFDQLYRHLDNLSIIMEVGNM